MFDADEGMLLFSSNGEAGGKGFRFVVASPMPTSMPELCTCEFGARGGEVDVDLSMLAYVCGYYYDDV